MDEVRGMKLGGGGAPRPSHYLQMPSPWRLTRWLTWRWFTLRWRSRDSTMPGKEQKRERKSLQAFEASEPAGSTRASSLFQEMRSALN